ncbi:MAG: hypothetical protein QF535_16005, partial [Anaerolineales bacterium]|nr:hypothetical protein [Anaerolineales bacterium]
SESAGLIARSASGWLTVVGSVITIVTTVWGWTEVAKTTNPVERMEKSKSFAITSTIAASATAMALVVAAVGGTLGPVGWVVSVIALVVAAAAAIVSYGGETREVTISSFCEAWTPPTGSEQCELCDMPVSEGGLAIDDGESNILTGWECSEYKCKSLGWNCEFVDENVGSDRAKCISVETNDVNHPQVVSFMVDVSDEMVSLGLDDTEGYVTSHEDYEFGMDGSEYSYLKFSREVKPYQTLTFGLELDEPAQCKIHENSITGDYSTMELYFPDTYFDYKHNLSWVLVPETEYSFYVSCQDYGGNDNAIDPFVFELTTDEGVDITTPVIEATSIRNGGYVAYNVNYTSLSIFVDEPANCKWDSVDSEYSLMEDYFACAGIPESASSLFDNECTASLPVNASTTNYYYFACEDAAGNANTENYAFTLQGTEELFLDYVAPNGTIYYDYTQLYAETSGGAEDGKAVCYYEDIEFFNSNSSIHTQEFEDLDAGDYEFEILCVDEAGNSDESSIAFTISVDTNPPEITSLYVYADVVYYEFDEDVSCEYYYEDFEFGAGTSVTGSFAVTELSTYYLTCQDSFENEVS